MDVGGTIPWMESVESSLEQRPGKRPEQVFERCIIYMDVVYVPKGQEARRDVYQALL